MIFTAASREKTVRKTYSSFSCGRHGRPAVRPPASGQASSPRPAPAPPCGLAVLPPGLGTCQGVRVDPPASQLAAPEPPGSAPSEPATTSFSKLPRTPLPSQDRRPRRGGSAAVFRDAASTSGSEGTQSHFRGGGRGGQGARAPSRPPLGRGPGALLPCYSESFPESVGGQRGCRGEPALLNSPASRSEAFSR